MTLLLLKPEFLFKKTDSAKTENSAFAESNNGEFSEIAELKTKVKSLVLC